MKASANGKTADVFIYGEITKYAWEEYGEVSSITFKNELDELGDGIETINLYINSPGGSVLKRWLLSPCYKDIRQRLSLILME